MTLGGALIDMQDPTEIVWNTITESAKNRFDYTAFERSLWDTESAHFSETVLFLTIVGHAADRSTDEIAADINGQLSLRALKFPEADLRRFIEEKKAELKREIFATTVAINLFACGLKPPSVLVQVRKILENAD